MDTKRELHLIKKAIESLEADLKRYGGGYRGASGDYDPKLYELHQELYGKRAGLQRTLKSEQRMARQRKAGKL